MTITLGTDIGGTFTDVVLATDDGCVHVAKTLTTPDDPVDGLIRGVRQVLDEAGVAPGAVGGFVHATTLATNVILERRGAEVAFVTTRGFRSMLALGRQARVEEERYDLAFRSGEPPVPLTHTFEVAERITAAGEVLIPLDEEDAAEVADRIADLGVASVAICLLHSYAEPAHERRLADLFSTRLPAGTTIVISSEVWPEAGEYERATTTLMSAYVGPVMAEYLRRLEGRLAEVGINAPVRVMESAGGVLPAALAAARAVYTIESGPAAGVIAAAREGARRGLRDLISFDMGGTTAKAGLVRDGRPGITHEFQVGGKGSFGGRRPGTGVPIKVPAIDLAEVGAGGGSIAWVDGGTLRVGPRSAGAVPGPACYGLGGSSPTVTDADLVLGYLDPDGFGDLRLRLDFASEAIASFVAKPLGVDVTSAAAAIHDIANAQMGTAVHVVTVRRGIDPRGFTLVALGGAAPTHAARLAERFGIGRVLVPRNCGVGSAAGLLHADLAISRSRTFLAPAASVDVVELAAVLDSLEVTCLEDLGVAEGRVTRSVGIRFAGQAHAFTIELGDLESAGVELAVEEFYRQYAESYGISLRDPVELTVARVRVVLPASELPTSGLPASEGVASEVGRRVWFAETGFVEVPVRERAGYRAGDEIEGPWVVTEPHASLIVPPGWRGTVDDHGAILLEGLNG